MVIIENHGAGSELVWSSRCFSGWHATRCGAMGQGVGNSYPSMEHGRGFDKIQSQGVYQGYRDTTRAMAMPQYVNASSMKSTQPSVKCGRTACLTASAIPPDAQTVTAMAPTRCLTSSSIKLA